LLALGSSFHSSKKGISLPSILRIGKMDRIKSGKDFPLPEISREYWESLSYLWVFYEACIPVPRRAA